MKYSGKQIAVFAATFMICAAPFAAGALTLDELQAQVASLLKQIAALQQPAQSSASSPASSETSAASFRVCSLLNRNLSVGARGNDVTGLQEFLQSGGFLTVTPTGYFGPATAQAVAKWQASEGISTAGAFGPMSRERLKVRCGGDSFTNIEKFTASPTQGSAPLTVSFNTWLSGFRINTISYAIEYGDGSSEAAANCPAPADACTGPGVNTHTYTQDGTYIAKLVKTTNTCPPGAQCFVAPQTQVVAQLKIAVGTGQSCKPLAYMPIACSDGTSAQPKYNESGCLIGYECPVQGYTPPATCKAWNDGCNECSRTSADAPAACTLRYCFAAGKGYCKVYFDSTAGGSVPSISSFSGPTTLAVNSPGTWTIGAADPLGGQLSYRVTWGDEVAYAPALTAANALQGFVQTTTFTHAYAYAGTYTVTVVVQNSAGAQSKTSTTVKVGGDGVICAAIYSPVCAQPPEPACRHTEPYCAIATPGPQTYSNRCAMNAAGATYLYEGECKTTTVCTADYSPVCGRPQGCANTCAPGMACPAICQLYPAQTYSNKCQLDAAGAQLLYTGQCDGRVTY